MEELTEYINVNFMKKRTIFSVISYFNWFECLRGKKLRKSHPDTTTQSVSFALDYQRFDDGNVSDNATNQ